MSRSRAIAVLASVLGNDLTQFKRFTSHLHMLSDGEITPAHLSGVVPEERVYLVFSELVTAGVILLIRGSIEQGQIESQALTWLCDHLQTYIEANAIVPSSLISSEVELAWTLPVGVDVEEGPAPRSLAALMTSVILETTSQLYIISPFLDEAGAEFLAGPIGYAARKAQTICIISHGLDELGSPGEAALRIFRRAAPRLRAYSAPSPEQSGQYVLLHAKMIVADGRRAVLASANLTRHGFVSHLEIGIGMTGKVASQLEALALHVINSGIVRLVL